MPTRDYPKFDKLYTLRPFLDLIKKKFPDHYHVGSRVAVDESMIKFIGRSSLKQYMLKKAMKRGCKVWVLADKLLHIRNICW